jgi:hypothetical protein
VRDCDPLTQTQHESHEMRWNCSLYAVFGNGSTRFDVKSPMFSKGAAAVAGGGLRLGGGSHEIGVWGPEGHQGPGGGC